jgi:transposase
MVMPQYFFDVRSIEWDYCDPDGITLADDEAAVTYAERMISELKADKGYDGPDLRMLVKDELQRTIVTIPFNPTKVRALGKSHAVMPVGMF